MTEQTPAPSAEETFKRATATVLKAIGHVADVEIAFVRDGATATQGRIKLPEIDSVAEASGQSLVRGAADAAAVRLRYHNLSLHAQLKPADARAADAFDALEQARCEALGAHRLLGLGKNIGSWLEDRARKKGFRDARVKGEVPLADALHFMAHERLAGQSLDKASDKALSVWRDQLDIKLGSFWSQLGDSLHDQKAFARKATELLHALDLKIVLEPEPAPDQPEQAKQQDHVENPEQKPKDDKSAESVKPDESGEDEGPEESASLTLGQGETQETHEQQSETESGPQDDFSNRAQGPVTTYRAYTRTYDEMVEAQDLCSASELVRLRRLLDHQLRPIQNVIVRLANKLQRRLMAQQLRAWEFDLEEGVLDAARLARVVANPLVPLSFKMEKETEFKDTVVSVLIDNSGSMRGRPITLAAISADILARTLERCGVKTEILGFTTRAWKGGKAREAWVEAGKPQQPGRLNDLRHIVYKEADSPWRRAKTHLGLMLKEGLLKENIDGEALLWAHERLLRRREDRRILMVISDGAPVDDSTLSANPQNYLDVHLRAVIGWIEEQSPVELCAIGIGHDVTKYYKRAVTISSPDDLGGTMTEQLAGLFAPV